MFCLNTCIGVTYMPAGTLGTGVTGGYELQCEHWESNLGLLQEQSVLLTTEPFLSLYQYLFFFFFIV